VLQTKAFDLACRFAIATHEDSVPTVNGTTDPFLDLPRQVVRLHLVNESSDRSPLVGLADNRSFDLIASDGG
jgi:FtsP/CotA-like multicopper oxidase with cupredoxin domain